MSKRCGLILCGGAGTRLWPLSTEERPKQFLSLIGDRSLFQQTFDRLEALVGADSIWIATVERYVPLILDQTPAVRKDRILVEPSRRNTAPAIAMAHALIAESVGEHRLGVFPSDHYISDPEAFRSAVNEAFDFVEVQEELVTLAIPPTKPETGFGYLELGESVSGRIQRVKSFVEKPDLATARTYLDSGRYAWNGGMFVWESDTFDAALERHAPEIRTLAHDIAVAPSELQRLYSQMPSVSIDYALMEKAGNVVTVAAEYGWSDVGSWSAVAELSPQSSAGAIHVGSNSWVRSGSGRTIAIAGADDLIVVETPDALLILHKDAGDLMREVAEKTKR